MRKEGKRRKKRALRAEEEKERRKERKEESTRMHFIRLRGLPEHPRFSPASA